MARILYFLLLIITSGQLWGAVATPEGDTYRYDSSHVSANTQNYGYGVALNLRTSGIQHSFESIGIEAEGESFLALFRDFIVTKGAGKEIGILRDAAKGKGNFGLGSGTRAEADKLGRAWVGDGYKLASDGNPG